MSQLKRFFKEETGMGVVEVVLIIVVLVGLVVMFNEEITDLVTKIFKSINKSAKKIIQWKSLKLQKAKETELIYKVNNVGKIKDVNSNPAVPI